MGEDQEKVHPCPHCLGEGTELVRRGRRYLIVNLIIPIPLSGRGPLVEAPCHVCGGDCRVDQRTLDWHDTSPSL